MAHALRQRTARRRSRRRIYGSGDGDWFATLFSLAALLLVPHAIIRPIIGIGLHHWIPIQWLALHAMLIILTLCVALAAYIIADLTAPEPPETY